MRTVETPTMMALMRVRIWWAQASVPGPLTQRESPEAAAIFPSRLATNFATTSGRPVVRCLM
jgi:hypothetical protein